MDALGETETVILELGYDRSEQHLFDGYRTTLEIVEALGDFFFECYILTGSTEDIPNRYPITPSRT